MNLNKVFLIGRLTDNPELRTTQGGQQVCSLRMATNRTWKNAEGGKQEAAEYHSVVLWGRLAEIASQYLRKGNMLFVEGRIQTRSWQDQQGVKKYRTEIIGENIQLGPKGFGGQASGEEPKQKEPSSVPPAGETTSGEEEIPIIEEEGEIDVKDIPF
ncbi:MAG: single-stranded DNA-binding protein [Candidatus Wildermuthbacteria bacterium]|nr:single-stranded DNA-binding protein [Candidatus Wildermuthbacteria bacterium]